MCKLIWEIDTRCPPASLLREIAMPALQDLYQATRGHVLLAMPGGDEALLVERLSKNTAIRPVARVGGRLPLHATGVGKAILAHSSPEVMRRILGRPLTRYTPNTITCSRSLRRELAAIREQGYATCYEERTTGLNSYAFPIYAHGAAVAAVSVVVQTGRKEHDGLLDALRPAAEQISRAMRKTSFQQPFGGV